MGDGGVGQQDLLDLGEIGRGVLSGLVHDVRAACDVEDLLGAKPVGAVDQHEALAVARHEARQHGLDRECPGALHRHGDEVGLAVDDLRQAFEHRLVDRDEGRVARAPVADHDLLDGLRGGQRAGRQQQRIAGFGLGGAAGGGHGLKSCCH